MNDGSFLLMSILLVNTSRSQRPLWKQYVNAFYFTSRQSGIVKCRSWDTREKLVYCINKIQSRGQVNLLSVQRFNAIRRSTPRSQPKVLPLDSPRVFRSPDHPSYGPQYQTSKYATASAHSGSKVSKLELNWYCKTQLFESDLCMTTQQDSALWIWFVHDHTTRLNSLNLIYVWPHNVILEYTNNTHLKTIRKC